MYEMREAEDAVEKVCKAQIEEKEEEEEVLEGAELCLVLVYHVRLCVSACTLTGS